MARTQFVPFVHGYHISNNDITWSWGPASGNNLCGGMSFASLDYFHYQLPIPSDRTAPEPETPVHNYIYQRQLHAHNFAIPTLGRHHNQWGSNSFTTSVAVGGAFGALKAKIDRGYPIPLLLGLAGRALSTSNHWVVATGYELANQRCAAVIIYDNAYPDEVCRLAPNTTSRTLVHNRSRRGYDFFIPHVDYCSVDPREPVSGGLSPQVLTNPLTLPPVGNII